MQSFEDAADSKEDITNTSLVPGAFEAATINSGPMHANEATPNGTTNGDITTATLVLEHEKKTTEQVGADSAGVRAAGLHAQPASLPSINDSAQQDTKSTESVKELAASLNQDNNSTTTAPPKPPPRQSRFQGFSASLPTVPWAAPPRKSVDARAPSPQPPPPTVRKASTPFGWLSRATSTPKEPRSPPLPARNFNDSRRNTAASISTLGSSPELTLKALDTQDASGSRIPAKASLREQFKMLRLREEAGIMSLEDPETSEGGALAGLAGRTTSIGMGVASPQSMNGDRDGVTSPGLPPPSPMRETAPVNPNLAPGTVAGVSAAVSDAATPIDWDFWQTVVNEGPQAVAKSSPEELMRAIAGGIPQTIRGVIWQVLASSKNDELESVYQELKVRGTDKEIKDAPLPTLASTLGGSIKEKDSTASEKSSINSDHSTPATSTNIGVASPSPTSEAVDPISSAKLQTKLATERAKKAKEDSAALSKLEKMIKRDMGSRTSYSKYAAAAGFQDGLFNVCKSYALFDEAVGYPQGMNFIIMPLLFTMPEEEAFCLLVRLMNKYSLRELFIQDMPGLHLHLYQFERMLEDLEPALYCHLNRRGVTPKLYATQWFLTLFAYRFPLQLVVRVFDLILCEGLEGAILKFGMAVVQKNVQALLAMNDMQELTNFLKEKLFDVYIDAQPSSKSILESGFFGNSGGSDTEIYRADLLVQDACSVKLTPAMLIRYREEYEEKTKTEKARETELENLRTDCATKASQIRSLEQRAEKSDSEHIQIANDLVRLKVENTELADHNESLIGQVQELKKVASSEAANVEERMRAGTEQVMQRNIEVQNENRNMEEQMAEMERELVEMKMKYAEVSNSGACSSILILTHPAAQRGPRNLEAEVERPPESPRLVADRVGGFVFLLAWQPGWMYRPFTISTIMR